MFVGFYITFMTKELEYVFDSERRVDVVLCGECCGQEWY